MSRWLLTLTSLILVTACSGETETTSSGDTSGAQDTSETADVTEDATSEDTATEDTATEDTASGDTAVGDTTAQDTAPEDTTVGDTSPQDTVGDTGTEDVAPVVCQVPPNVAEDVVLGPDFAGVYTVYDLGPVPGVPDRLGGCTISWQDEDTLLIAGNSEDPGGQIYAIGVERGPCGHILGFVGEAEPVAETPYVDANLVYADNGVLLYTRWPQFTFSQLPLGANTPARDTDLTTLGMSAEGDSGPGGVGRLPESLSSGREHDLRMVTWPAGRWFQVELEPDGDLWSIAALTQTATLPNNPGGFAYVPPSSPGFDAESIIVSEWVSADASRDRVAVYEVDADGDPIVDTRREFFTTFSRPWGAYFDPPTGDFLFLQWGGPSPPDRVFIVQGFLWFN